MAKKPTGIIYRKELEVRCKTGVVFSEKDPAYIASCTDPEKVTELNRQIKALKTISAGHPRLNKIVIG